MSSASAKKLATYSDVLAAPRHVVAELINGELHLSARPRSIHSRAASRLGDLLGGPFDRGSGGPGGWILLDEPELHLPSIVVPDLAGWRRERMPELPDEAFFTLAPDWICEVLSPSTEDFDRVDKLPVYLAAGVTHAWLADPGIRTLEAFQSQAGNWQLVGAWKAEARARIPPFEAFELDLGLLWAR